MKRFRQEKTIRDPNRVRTVKIRLRPSQVAEMRKRGLSPSEFIRLLVDAHFNKIAGRIKCVK